MNNRVNNTKHITPSPTPPSSIIEGRKEIACQTLSTGDIVMMKVFFEEDKQNMESILMSSPKREKWNQLLMLEPFPFILWTHHFSPSLLTTTFHNEISAQKTRIRTITEKYSYQLISFAAKKFYWSNFIREKLIFRINKLTSEVWRKIK